eukprot:1559002-Pleurochrysis_carterae.AAC.1
MYSQVNRAKQVFIRETVLGALCIAHSSELDLLHNEQAIRLSVIDFAMSRRFPDIVPSNAKLFWEGDELIKFSLESASLSTLEELRGLIQTRLTPEFPACNVSYDDPSRLIIDTGAQMQDGSPVAPRGYFFCTDHHSSLLFGFTPDGSGLERDGTALRAPFSANLPWPVPLCLACGGLPSSNVANDRNNTALDHCKISCRLDVDETQIYTGVSRDAGFIEVSEARHIDELFFDVFLADGRTIAQAGLASRFDEFSLTLKWEALVDAHTSAPVQYETRVGGGQQNSAVGRRLR